MITLKESWWWEGGYGRFNYPEYVTLTATVVRQSKWHQLRKHNCECGSVLTGGLIPCSHAPVLSDRQLTQQLEKDSTLRWCLRFFSLAALSTNALSLCHACLLPTGHSLPLSKSLDRNGDIQHSQLSPTSLQTSIFTWILVYFPPSPRFQHSPMH